MNQAPTLIFWNAQSLVKDVNTLHILLQPTSPAPSPTPLLLAFVETWFSEKNTPAPPTNYTWSQLNAPPAHSNNRSYGGIALLYHNQVPTQPLSQHSKLLIPPPHHDPTNCSLSPRAAILWHRVRLPNTPTFLLGIIYIPPQNHTSAFYVHQCIESIRAVEKDYPLTPYLIVGDLNLHHPLWDSRVRSENNHNSAARTLARLLNSDDVTLLNNVFTPDQPTRTETGSKPSVIDLAFTNSAHLVSHMTMIHATHLVSDHKPLTITFCPPRSSTAPKQPPHETWSVNDSTETWKANLPTAIDEKLRKITPTLQRLLEIPTSHQNAQHTIEDVYQTFEDTLVDTLHTVVGTHTVKHTQNGWFNHPEVQRLYNELIRSRKIANLHNSSTYHHHQRRLKRALKTLIRKIRGDQWKTLCDMLSSTDKRHAQWTLLKRTTPTTYTPLSSIAHPVTNDLPSSHEVSLDNLALYFTASNAAIPPRCSSQEEENRVTSVHHQHALHTLASTLPTHTSDSWTFTPKNVKQQCTTQYTDTAPGPDRILPVFLKHASDALYAALSMFYNYSWTHSVLPSAWSRANMMALYKGKGSLTDPASYRPISMTSIVIRTFEHLIHTKLTKVLDNNNYFHHLQFGFRAKHSTYDAINHLLSSIKKTCKNDKNPPCPVIFLDLSKAFDYVWHPLLLERLQSAGITGRAWRWINSFLSNRNIRIIDKSITSGWYPTQYGVPQGCVLSPLLFLVFINDVSKQITEKCPTVSPLLYADDKALAPNIYYKGSYNVTTYIRDLQTALNLLTTWCGLSRMKFGEKKTEVVAYCGAQKDKPEHVLRYSCLKLTDFTIRVVPSYTYLGLTVDRKLNWNAQYNRVLKIARSDSYKLTRISIATSDPHPAAIRTLCVGYLRPRCTYGFAFWSHSLTQSKIRKLQAAFVQPLRRCLSLPITTHQLGILVEYNCPSLSAFRAHCLLSWTRRAATSDPTHPTRRLYKTDITPGKKTLEKNYLNPIKYAPTSLIAHYDTMREAKDKLPIFITTHDPHSTLPDTITDKPIKDLTKEELSQLQMWITHLEWRTGTTFGDRILSTDTAPTTRLLPRTTPNTERKERSNRKPAAIPIPNPAAGSFPLSTIPSASLPLPAAPALASEGDSDSDWREHKYDSDSDSDNNEEDGNDMSYTIPSSTASALSNYDNLEDPSPFLPPLDDDDVKSLMSSISPAPDPTSPPPQQAPPPPLPRPAPRPQPNFTSRRIHITTAPLLLCKNAPQRSHYLYHTEDRMLTMRARLRHNRVHNQDNRHCFPSPEDEKKVSPYCTHPTCLNTKHIDDVSHILLHCPRHTTSRNTLTQSLATKHSYTDPLSISLITGSIPYLNNDSRRQLFTSILSLTTTFLLSIMSDRATDPTLVPLTKSR